MVRAGNIDALGQSNSAVSVEDCILVALSLQYKSASTTLPLDAGYKAKMLGVDRCPDAADDRRSIAICWREQPVANSLLPAETTRY